MTTEKLLRLKKEIDKAKEELSELKGKKKVLLERLKNEFNCAYKDIDKVKQQLREKADELEEEKEALIKELEEEYDF